MSRGRLTTRITDGLGAAWRRFAADAWPLTQQTVAAAIAWMIALQFGGHGNPFFAPIAAVVALNAARGERGANAVRLFLGVIAGITTGEVVVAALGGGYGSLALATFIATALVRALGGSPIVVAQAAASAILTVAAADGQAGPNRLIDATIGAGVALVFSQLLFSPEPLALLRRAESRALAGMAEGLGLTARALEQDDDQIGGQAVTTLRLVRDQLSELGRVREASGSVSRRTLAWRSRAAPVVQEQEQAGHLDLLGGSCLMLARAATSLSPDGRRMLTPSVQALTGVLDDLVASPGDRATRQGAVDRCLEVAHDSPGPDLDDERSGGDARTALRMVTTDVLVFAGVRAEQAVAAVHTADTALDVPAGPDEHHIPLFSRLWQRVSHLWQHFSRRGA